MMHLWSFDGDGSRMPGVGSWGGPRVASGAGTWGELRSTVTSCIQVFAQRRPGGSGIAALNLKGRSSQHLPQHQKCDDHRCCWQHLRGGAWFCGSNVGRWGPRTADSGSIALALSGRAVPTAPILVKSHVDVSTSVRVFGPFRRFQPLCSATHHQTFGSALRHGRPNWAPCRRWRPFVRYDRRAATLVM